MAIAHWDESDPTGRQIWYETDWGQHWTELSQTTDR
jgi:hypothetical protein